MPFDKGHFQKYLQLAQNERTLFHILGLPIDCGHIADLDKRVREARASLRSLHHDPDIQSDFEWLDRHLGEASLKLATPASRTAYTEELIRQRIDGAVRFLAESRSEHPLTAKERIDLVDYVSRHMSLTKAFIVRTVDGFLAENGLCVETVADDKNRRLTPELIFQWHCRLACEDGVVTDLRVPSSGLSCRPRFCNPHGQL